ncbi:hypothetical protein SB660_18885, partial [Bacillus sp. SIMBA_005]
QRPPAPVRPCRRRRLDLAAAPRPRRRFGTFVSPIHLPLWLNIALGAGAALASMERGLRLRYHWMLDGLGN